MDKREVVLLMLREIADMSSEDFIYFCIMLRASRPDEMEEQIEYIIRSLIRIRKAICRRNAVKAVFSGRIYHAGVNIGNKKPHRFKDC